jgi:hypothetical protein
MNTTITFHAEKVAVVTIPKVAGSSIKAAVLEMRGVPIEGEDVPHRHDDLELCSVDDVPRDYWIFAFLRNPWDRLVSCYEQKICTWRCKKQGFNTLGCRQGMPFDEFLGVVCKKPRGNPHWQPQGEFIGQRDTLRLYDFQDLARGWRHLQDIVKGLPALPHLNRSKRKEYRGYYNDLDRRRVEMLCFREIELMGYRF